MKYWALFDEKNNQKIVKKKTSNDHQKYIIKTFKTKKLALDWLKFLYYQKNYKQPDSIFCDSSYRKNNKFVLLKIYLLSNKKYLIFKINNITNNQGELIIIMLTLIYSLLINKKIKLIFSDSKLVLYFWSLNIINSKDDFTKELSKFTHKLRQIFFNKKGKVSYISGDKNPADLGFHK